MPHNRHGAAAGTRASSKLEETGLSALLVVEQHGEDGAQICPWTGAQDLWNWSCSSSCPPARWLP